MFGIYDVTLVTRVLYHVAPRMVSAVVRAADGAAHVSWSTASAASHTPGHSRVQVLQARLPVSTSHLAAGRVRWKRRGFG